MIKKGDRVKVDFTNNPETIHSGIRFTGYGVVDRFEDNRVFGRLDDGRRLCVLRVMLPKNDQFPVDVNVN